MKQEMFTKLPEAKRFLLAAAAVLTGYFSYAQPANNECSGAIAVVPSTTTTCSSPVSSSTNTATMSATSPSCGSTPVSDVWYSFVAGSAYHKIALSNVVATNTNANTFFTFGVAVYSGTCGAPIVLGCSFGYNSGFGNEVAELTLGGLTVGNTYYVQVWSDQAYDASFNPVSNEINFDLCITTAPQGPANDLCSGALLLAQGVAVTGDNTNATDDDLTGQPACGSSGDGEYKGVWYTATPTASGNLTIASCGSSFDTYLKVFSGGNCSAFTTCEGSNDDGCSAQSTITFAAVAGTTYYILLAGYGSGAEGTFTISATGVALPVTMDALTGKIGTDNRAVLNWNTYTEQNNKGFEIQRSADGKVFTPAGFVASKGNKGNSNEQIAYSFTDPVAIDGAAYYRLQQTDIDGKKDYSNIVRLGTESTATFSLLATPNPVKDRLNIKTYGQVAGNAYLLIMDMSGKVLQRQPMTTETTGIDMSGLAQGIYLLKYIDANRTEMLKISKQ